MLFTINVATILASGIVSWASTEPPRAATGFHRGSAVAVIACLLLVVIVPLWINTDRIDKTSVRKGAVQGAAEQWANDAGWSVAGVTATGDQVLVEVTGPSPPASPCSAATERRRPERTGRPSQSGPSQLPAPAVVTAVATEFTSGPSSRQTTRRATTLDLRLPQ